MAIDVKGAQVRRHLISMMQRTILNWDTAIAKHGPIENYLRSRALEENTLAGFLEGAYDANGNPLR